MLKKNSIMIEHLKMRNISLSQTNWLTERKNIYFFIHRASYTLLHQDDIGKAIKENMDIPQAFGIYPNTSHTQQ